MKRLPLARYGPGPVLGLVLAGMAAVLLAVATWRAIRVESISGQELAGVGFEPAIPNPPDSTSADRVAVALDNDPFHPERRRPGRRFRLPGERRPQSARPAGLPESVRLTGTIVYQGGGGAAILQRPGYSTLMIRVGERLEGLELVRVTREQAVFRATTGTELVINVSQPGG